MMKFFISLLLVMFVLSCSNKTQDKEIILGTAPILPPFTYHNDNNEVVGFDIEIATKIAEELNRELKIEVMPFSDLLAAVDSGAVDMAISLIAITDERREIVDFSDAYFSDDTVALIRKKDLPSFRHVYVKEDLGLDKKLSSLSGTLLEGYVSHIAGTNEALMFDKLDDSVNALQNNQADVVIVTTLGAKSYIAKDDTLMILPSIVINTTRCGVAVKKGNKKLLESINITIKKLINSGEYDRLVREFLG